MKTGDYVIWHRYNVLHTNESNCDWGYGFIIDMFEPGTYSDVSYVSVKVITGPAAGYYHTLPLSACTKVGE